MESSKTYKITYVKAYDYKTSFVSGVHGGLGSNGLLNVSFFADRPALPDTNIVEINEQNIVTKSEDVKTSDMVRDVQFGLVMDINTTKLVVNWLQSRIKEYEENIKKINHG